MEKDVGDKSKVVWITILLVAGLWASLSLIAWQEREKVLALDAQSQLSLTEAVGGQFDGLVKLIGATLDTANLWAAARPESELRGAAELRRLRDKLNHDSDGIVELRLIDRGGRLVGIGEDSATVPKVIPTDVRDHDFHRLPLPAASVPHAPFIGVPMFDRSTAAWMIPLTVPAAGGRDAAMLFAGIRLDRLAELHERLRFKPGGGIAIIRKDGILLSRTPFVEGLIGRDISSTAEFTAHLRNQGRGIVATDRGFADGVRRYGSYVNAPDRPFIVSTAKPLDEVLAGWRAEMLRSGAVAGGLSGLALVYAVRLRRTVRAAATARRQSESAFRRFTDIVETANDLIWEVDESFRYTYASERHRSLMGVPPEEMLGKTAADFGWVPEDPAVRSELIHHMERRLPFAGQQMAMRARGGRRYVMRLEGRPFFHRDGSFAGYRGTATDITDRLSWSVFEMLADAPFQDRVGRAFLHELLHQLARVAGTDIALIGRLTGTRSVTTLHALVDGKEVENFTYPLRGTPCADVLEKGICVYEGDLASRFPQDALLAEMGVTAYVGTALHDSGGKPMGILVLLNRGPMLRAELARLAMKITAPRAAAELERLLTEAELEESQARLRAAVQHLPFDFWILGRDGRYQLQNAASMRRWGDWIGRRPEEVGTDPDSLAQWQETNRRALAGEVVEQEVCERRPEGDRHVLAICAPIRVGDDVVAIMGVNIDITEHKRLENEARRRSEIEAQAGKMEALGRLAGGVAHDFNNLLGAILGFSHFLMQDLEPGSPTHRFAERIATAGQRGKALVQQILTFSRRNVVEPSTVPLGDLVTETLTLLNATLPSTTRLTAGRIDRSLLVRADRTQLAQVVMNLCVNASDSLEGDHGDVSVDVESYRDVWPAPADPQAEPGPGLGTGLGTVRCWTGGDGSRLIAAGCPDTADLVVLRVSDTGSGIPADVGEHLFDPFFTTKERGRGTGLGLAVVHTIVTQHRGAILVRTRQGGGSTFEIVLPRVEADASAEDAADRGAGPGSGHPATILVVDDDSEFCDMVETVLSRLGHQVVATNDPQEALAAVGEDPGLWDMVVTDQTMPGLKGGELVRRVKALRPGIRCIICTGYSSSMNEEEATSVGADAFMTKPLDIDGFAAAVERLLHEDAGRAEAVPA